MRPQYVAGLLAAVLALPVAGPAQAAGSDPTPPPTPTPAPTPTEPPVTTRTLSARFALDPTERYGVGQLVTVRFSEPVTRKAAAERGLSVSSDTALPSGSWGWIDDRTVVYRPKRFWPGNAVITFTVALKGVVLSTDDRNRWVGGSPRRLELRTTRSFVITIRDKTHDMEVRQDGKVLRRLPVSLGKKGWETYSGIKILTSEKYRRLRMVGNFPKRDSSWDVIAPYSMRLTPNGEFIHGAPWARYRIGKFNGSHGCTNMFPRHARWLYERVQAGDPVITTGTGRPMPVTQGRPGAYWNYPWKKWLTFSALRTGPGDGSEPVTAAGVAPRVSTGDVAGP